MKTRVRNSGPAKVPFDRPAPFLSLVVPCYNEAQRLPATLNRIYQYLARTGHDAELILVDDGSSDGTARIANAHQELFRRFIVISHPERRGKGAAVRTGFERARGDIVLFTDADLSTPITELDTLAQALRDGADVAVASRHVRGSRILLQQPFRRRIAGFVFRKLTKMIVRTGVEDTQCGFKVFRRDVAHWIARNATVNGWAFDVEFLALARAHGCRIDEIPVPWLDDARSRVKLRSASLEMLRDIINIRRRVNNNDPAARTGNFPGDKSEIALAELRKRESKQHRAAANHEELVLPRQALLPENV